MTGLWVAQKEAGRKQIAPEIINDFFCGCPSGINCRCQALLYCIYRFFVVLGKPGFDPGGLAGGNGDTRGDYGGLLTAVFYTRRHKISFWKFADTLAPSLILGQAIGRIGCFLNGDAHGYPTDLPWGMIYNKRLGMWFVFLFLALIISGCGMGFPSHG